MRFATVVSITFATLAMTAAANADAGTGKFCIQGGPSATLKCEYQTMAQCDKAKQGAETCIAKPGGTTGSGMMQNGATKK